MKLKRSIIVLVLMLILLTTTAPEVRRRASWQTFLPTNVGAWVGRRIL
jgi:hypothetical protein